MNAGGTSLRISHHSPGLSPGGETTNDQQIMFIYEMNQKKEEMDKKIEDYQLQIQA